MLATILFLFTFLFGYLAGFWTLVALLKEEQRHGKS